jgi:SAM-dependent methyltransferase
MTLNGELYISPLPPDAGLNVLDIGTGTGIWAIEFAQEHPASVVTGLDLSPIQPPMVPPNCSFIVDNAEMDWIYSQPFDFIHARMLTFGIRDWPRLFRQSWDHLKPGGWVELQELRMPCRCDDGTAPRESPLINWSHIIVDSLATTGIDPVASDKFEQQLAEQGFVNIKAETIKWAIGSWPKGKREKEIGRWTAVNTLSGIQGISLAVLTRQLRWSPEAVELLLMDVRKQIMDRNSHAYISV